MKKTIVALSLAAMTLPALAQQKAAEPEYTIAGNFGLFSDYRFRGISQTDLGPALQGGFDFAHKSGFYLGTWASSISEFTSFNGDGMEIDFYGGYKFAIGDVGVDIGNLYYYYPGAVGAPDKPNTNELYVGLSYGPVSLKTSYATTKYFGLAETKGTLYYDLTASVPLADGLTLTAHAGYLDLNNAIDSGTVKSGTDYRLAISKSMGAYTLSAAYIGNSGDWKRFNSGVDIGGGEEKDLGKSAVVLSISATF
jgi:uncharacterized protein (TIGR02001 family)